MQDLSPLNTVELQAIDTALERKELGLAQQLLAQIDHHPEQREAVSYLATRLLFLRERLDSASVAERLREIITHRPDFPEALALLRETGGVSPSSYPTSMTGTASQPPPALGQPTVASDHQAPVDPNFTPAYFNRTSAPRAPSVAPFDFDDSHQSTRPPVPERSAEHRATVAAPPDPAHREIRVDTRSGASPARGDSTAPRDSAQLPGRWGQEGASLRPEGRYSRSSDEQIELKRPKEALYSTPTPFSRPPSRRAPPPPRGGVTIPSAPALPSLNAPSQRPAVLPPRREQEPPVARPRRARSSSMPPPEEGGRYAFSMPAPASPASQPPQVASSSATDSLWTTTELKLWQGGTAEATESLERVAREQIAALGSGPNLTKLARAGAELLSTAPVVHLFAPYDQSLISLARLNLALSAVLGTAPPGAACPNLVLLCGAYLGETLRHTQRGQWHGEPSKLLSLTVRVGATSWAPFHIMRQRFSAEPSPSLQEAIETGLARPGTPPWFESRPPPEPRELWRGPPALSELPALAHELCQSPLSLLSRDLLGHVLDGSQKSITPLGELFGMLTTSSTALTGNEVWLQRLCLLVGSYTGAVLQEACGGTWTCSGVPSALADYSLQLGSGQKTQPMSVAQTHAVCQQPDELVKYVADLIRS